MSHIGIPIACPNRAVQQAGAKALPADIHGERVSCLSRPYAERSRQMIVDKIAHTLADADRRTVTDWLEKIGLNCFL